MKIGFIGLGRMGHGVVENLLKAGHEVTVWNRSPEPVAAMVAKGAKAAKAPEDAMQGEPQDLFRVPRMEEQFKRHPDSEPVDKGRDKGDGVQPPGDLRHINSIIKQKIVVDDLLLRGG